MSAGAGTTFRRVDTRSPRSGNTVGVLIPYQPVVDRSYLDIVCSSCPPPAYFYPGVILDDPAQVARNPGTTYMKNWFDDASVPAGSAYFSFENDQPGFRLEYFTYGLNNATNPGQIDWRLHDDNLSIGTRNLTSDSAPNTILGTETCDLLMFNAGLGPLARGTGKGHSTATIPSSSNSLSQNWPNPTASTTAFTYQVKTGAQQAELIIRRATDGREMQQIHLDVHSTSQEISVRGWPTGTYFVTLVVDKVPSNTKRLLVE